MEKEPKIEITDNPEESNETNRINDFYDYATKRNEALKDVSESETKLFIGEAVKEIDDLEKVAERDKGKLDLPVEIAKDIGTVWVVSGSGTYFEPKKEDRYKTYSWADWMDRTRVNHATRLIREITEKVSGQDFKAPLSAITSAKAKTKKAILEYGPDIIYNGGILENEAIIKLLAQEGTVIPKEKVDVIEKDPQNTIDQIKSLASSTKFKKDKEIAIVAHAPHLIRIIRMINRYKPFPEGTKIRLFPVPTPKEGKEDYAKMEVSGALYYTYITKDADKDPYPYEISYPLIEEES